MGQNGSFKILGKSEKTGTSSDGVDLTKITFRSDFVDETKANGPCNSIAQKYCSSLEKSDINRWRHLVCHRAQLWLVDIVTQGERPTVPRYTHDEKELWPPRKVKEISSNGQNDKEKANKEYYETKIASLEYEVQQLRAEKERLMASTTKPFGESQQVSKDNQERMQILEVEVQQLKEEKHKLFVRLSEIGAVQLTDNNPNMANLSDDNRPDKLAEQMSELYDNEWTDAFEYITRIEGLQDEKTVRQLLIILHTIYAVCLGSTKKQTEDLKNAMLSYLGLPEERKDDFTIKEALKRLRESRATEFEATLGRIIKDARHQLTDLLEGRDCDILDKYIQKCTHVCWFMCIKDPPMYLDFDGIQRKGPSGDDANDFPLQFDTTKFVSYTRAGMNVEYVVWPAVYLYKNGPIVKRGIAQGFSREPEANASTVEMKGEDSNDNSDTINADADQGYNGDSPNSDIPNKEDEDGDVSHDPLCTDDSAQETDEENAKNLNSPCFNELDDLVDADLGYDENIRYSDGPKSKDEDEDIRHNHHCSYDMAQDTDEEHAQNLNSLDFNEHDDLSDAEDCDDSNETTKLTISDVNDGYDKLTYGTNVSKEDENIRCQDEFHTEEPIFGNDVNIEKAVFSGSKEHIKELKANGSRTGLYKKKEKKK